MSRQAGQQTAEFAMLIGLAALAAVSMQLLVRRAIQTGVGQVTDAVLPPSAKAAQDDEKRTVKALSVKAAQGVDEIGSAGLQRRTTMLGGVAGHSRNEDVRFQDVGEHLHEQSR